MAAPNLKSPTTITGRTKTYSATTTLGEVLANPAASNKSFKINSLYCANIDGATTTDVSIVIRTGATDRYLAKTIAIPPDATQLIVTREGYIYLEEGMSIWAQANADNDVDITIGYEEIA